ncbi:MAG: helix-turn-helix transcriptional regulator [Oligoflexales bacterium]
MAGRNTQISRIYMILNILEGAPHGLSALQITDRLNDRFFEVSKRTVYRDLEALRAAGFSLDEAGSTDKNGTRWTLERNVKVGLALNSRELIALYLARKSLDPLKESPFYEDLQSTFDKIEEKIDSKKQNFLKELQKEIYFEQMSQWSQGFNNEIIDTIRACCNEQQKLEIVYASAKSGSTGKRVVGPHYLYIAKKSIYLVAEDIADKTVKVFSVARIHQAEMVDEVYEGTIIEPEKYFNSAFGIFRSEEPTVIKLLFKKSVAAYIKERKWHASQQSVSKDDGSVELIIETGVTPELVSWVQGFGADVKIKEPKKLIDALCDRSVKTLAQYGKTGKAS